MNITGTLSPNNLNQVQGSWEHVQFSDKLPGRTGIAGAVVFTGSQQHVVSIGGCPSSNASTACADGMSFVLNVDAKSANSPLTCPAPRNDPAVTANMAPPTTFNSQVYQLLGTYNTTLWDDDNGLNRGEVVSTLIVTASLPTLTCVLVRTSLISARERGPEFYHPAIQVRKQLTNLLFPLLVRVQ